MNSNMSIMLVALGIRENTSAFYIDAPIEINNFLSECMDVAPIGLSLM